MTFRPSVDLFWKMWSSLAASPPCHSTFLRYAQQLKRSYRLKLDTSGSHPQIVRFKEAAQRGAVECVNR